MDLIRITKVDRVHLLCNGTQYVGAVHLTTHHIIFSAEGLELWIGYPLIHSAILKRPPKLQARKGASTANGGYLEDAAGFGSAASAWEQQAASSSIGHTKEELSEWAMQGSISIRCQHFMFLTLQCESVRQLYDMFATIKHLSCVSSTRKLYAFTYQPYPNFDKASKWGWKIYDPRREFERMGVGKEETGKHWRFTNVNMGYQLCSTYPPVLVVPARISDTTLTYAARYRSKGRLPVLCYLHGNKASMTRSSQPMVGLKQARSVQDEKLVEAIIASSEQDGVAPRFDNERKNIIIDARPTTNAVVNRAVGAGSENMDHYRRCRKVYLGIDNIHVMRDALNKLVDAIQSDDNVDRGVVARIQKSSKTNWLKHIENIMVGVKTIVEAIDQGRHVVVHCSDGWDRTAQLTSLAQLCLDPYYRTIEGFAVLVEKEWVSFGHQFSLRCGHTGHPERFKVTRAANRRRPKEPLDDDAADSSSSPAAVDNSDAESSVENSAVGTENGGAEAGSGFDFVQTTSSMFGRFATRAFKTVQSRVSSAIQAASDNLDDAAMDDPDPFYTDYPDLQPNYVPPRSSSLSDGEAKSTGGFRLVRSKHDHETSPVFHQFLDCVFQLCVQHPTMFEFNERFLLDLFYHLYSAQFGSFLGNNARERADGDFYAKSHSIWSWVGQKMNETDEEGSDGVYRNDLYNEDTAGEERTKVILPDTAYIQYWSALFSCHDPALADREETTTAIATETTATATTFREEAEDEESAKAAETAAKEEKQGAEAAETRAAPVAAVEDVPPRKSKATDPLTAALEEMAMDGRNVWAD